MSFGMISQFIEASRVLIENARSLPEISSVLAGYGYDSRRLGEGAELWAKADALVRRQAQESGEQRQASSDAEKAWGGAEAAYMKALKVARVAFADDAPAGAALKLGGHRRQSVAGWIDQAATFYANLGPGSRLAPAMLRFGYTAGKLQTEATLIEALRAALQAQAKETGESQAATAARDASLRELDTWVSELRAIAKVAFYETPQELEKLGILARSSPKRKKAEAPAAAKT